MIRNYFSIAFRSIRKNKAFTAINVLGLSIGISAALVICLLVQYDFNFDNFHKDGDRIYRAVTVSTFADESYKNPGITSPMADALQKEGTGIEIVAPLRTEWQIKVSIPTTSSNKPVVFKKQANVVYADERYFKIIEYKWLAGNPAASLKDPYKVVLTSSIAAAYFPKAPASDLVGREIYFNDTIRSVVSGIVADIDKNTDFNFQVFISRATLETTSLKPRDWQQWNNTNSSSQLWMKLAPATTPKKVEAQMLALFEKNRHKEVGETGKTEHLLQPLSDMHFNADYGNYHGHMGHKPTLYGLLAVAAFLLLLGCINFINLTTAQASQRAKEIGIRKTMGSSKGQLIFQFMSETFLITFIATVLSVIMAPLILKIFGDFIPSGLHFNLFQQPLIIVFLLLLLVIVTLIAGFYPAIILSGYKPVTVLKNQVIASGGRSRNANLRRSLTVAQFVIAQVFVIATMMVGKQINYTLNKDLGFKKDAIITLSTNFFDKNVDNKNVFLQKLKAIPEISMISLSSNAPASGGSWSSTMKYKDGKKEIETDVQIKLGDTNYLRLYDMKLLAGTYLEPSDTVRQIIINQTYSKVLGFQNPQDAIGKIIEWDDKQVPIVAVAADFHQQSLRTPIKPLIISSWASSSRTFNIALQPQNAEGTVWSTAIAKVEKAWKEIYPEDDFEYSFLSEDIAKYYNSEKNVVRLLSWATGLAIFISCLGLLGLVIFITVQRTKEIGVRKVIGASVSQIVSLLSKDFLKLVLIAFVIAVPIAWWGAHKWLDNFAYKTELSWWIFLIGGVVMALLALITISIQTIRAALANPVDSLRTE
ncbi:MAG: ABC transporter permease [Chitinophagaceae bacterium]|nr:ABC transporter permease [Chitinophagaceae bacterium]